MLWSIITLERTVPRIILRSERLHYLNTNHAMPKVTVVKALHRGIEGLALESARGVSVGLNAVVFSNSLDALFDSLLFLGVAELVVFEIDRL